MTINQILTGVALILVLTAGSQVLASRLRIPALIVLLPVGFTAGALTSDVNPEKLLRPAFEPLCHCPWPSSCMTPAWAWICGSSRGTPAGS